MGKQALIFYLFLVAGTFWIPRLFRSRLGIAGFALAYLFISLVVYGLAEGNIGTAYRHRTEFVWLLFIPGAAYLTDRLKRWRRQRFAVEQGGSRR